MLEAFSVAIRLKLLDSVSAGLIGLSSQFLAFNRHVNASRAELKAFEGQLQRIKTLGFVGGAALGVGAAGLMAFRAPLEEAKKWTQESARFASLGFGDKVNKDAQQFALGMKTYGVSARENLQLVGDAMAQFKNLDTAKLFAPVMSAMKFGNEAVYGDEAGGANERKFQDMLQLIDIRGGVTSEAQARRQANFLQRVISGSRGRVDAMAMLQAARTGGVATSQLSDEAFYLGLEPIVREFGGMRTGTGLMSIYQNLVQSRGTITAQQELYRLGLLDKSKVTFNQLGQLKKALPGAFKGSDVLEREGPLALLEKVLLPAFGRHGITTDGDVIRELGMVLGNRTGSSLMSRIYQQRSTIAMQSAANRNAMDIDQLAAAGRATPEGKMLELHAKWRDVLRELGIAVLPIAIKAVEGLTSVVKTMLSFAREFPTITKGIVILSGTLFGLIAVGGAVTLATAGFRALGLAMALGKGLSLGAQLLQVAGGIGAFASTVGMLAGKLGLIGAAGGVGYMIGDAINKMGPRGDLGGYLGGKFYDWLHPYDPNKGSPYVAGAKSGNTVIHTQVNLDGRKVGSAVSKYQGIAANAPQTGPSSFDPRQALMPAGAVGVY